MKHCRRSVVIGAFTLLASGAVAAAGATPALAAGTFTLTAGSAAPGTVVSFTGTSGPIVLTDTTTNQTVTCATGSAKGSTTVGSGLSGTAIATVDAPNSKLNNCTGPFGIGFVGQGAGTWTLDAQSVSGTVTTGRLTNISATVKDATGFICSFTATGSVDGSFDSATQTLTAGGNSDFTLANVSGCLGLANNGDKGSVTAAFTIAPDNPANGPVTVTSP